MKKLVLILLLTIPHVACGSEVRLALAGVRKDFHAYQDHLVEGYKVPQIGAVILVSESRTDIWTKGMVVDSDADLYVGIDSDRVCAGTFKKIDNHYQVGFSLYGREDGNLIKTGGSEFKIET